jgi:hypothetical protein
MILATVCRSGGHYDHRWALALERIAFNLLEEHHRFVCLTDLDPALFGPQIHVEPLLHGWPGWWSKIELFRPGLFREGERVVYMDLDTVPIHGFGFLWGALDCCNDLWALRDFYRPDTGIGSGLMGWEAGECDYLYRGFVGEIGHPDEQRPADSPSRRKGYFRYTGPSEWMSRFKGDQDFIQHVVHPYTLGFWQDEFPGKVVSYKVHCNGGPPSGSKVVCFHGRPRPDQADEPWVTRAWRL